MFRISSFLKRISYSYNIAVIVMNEMVANFNNGTDPLELRISNNVVKMKTSDIVGSDPKKPALGFLWDSCVNVRICVSCTSGTARVSGNKLGDSFNYDEETGIFYPTKISSHDGICNSQTVREMKVMFSPYCKTNPTKFIICKSGIQSLL